MNTFVVNGKFMADRMQGIVRYGRELLKSLDKILSNNITVILAIPLNAKNVPEYKNIKIVKIGRKTGIKWELIDYAIYLRKNNEFIPVNLCNVCPFFVQPGITVVHDIMYKTFPDNYRTFRNKISRLWHCIQYKYIFCHEIKIITVSNFSKLEINRVYPETKNKISVIPNGWEHVLEYKENNTWYKKYPELKNKSYFFSLSTIAKNKNIKWIIEVARNTPNSIFAIGGKIYGEDLDNLPTNVKLLGFISDEDACSLIKNCKAFLFPSLYEGFGIPPLEALALGAKVISSNRASMPEILENSVYYIDPTNYDVNLDEILTLKVDDKDKILNTYSFNNSAILLKKILEDII